MRRTSALIALLILTACGSDAPSGATPAAGVPTFVRLESDPAESLGGGGTYEYSKTNALVTLRPLGAQLALRVVGDRVWDGFIGLSSNESKLRAGTFSGLTNTPLLGGTGFRWSSQEKTCIASVATVTIDAVKYDGEALRAIDLRFEQRCDGQGAALRGTVHWRAADDALASGPLVPVPTTLWRAPAGSTPANGNYVYLDGPATLIFGTSLPQLIGPGAMQARVNAGALSINAVDTSSKVGMLGFFKPMIGQTAFQEGYYRDVRGLDEDPAAGALDVAVNAWDCASLVGWYAIDRVFYFQGNLTVLELRFELRCKGFGAPLRGQMRWEESG